MPVDPVKADCHTDYKATRHSGTRPLSAVKWVVMHDTEGGTAKSIAQYFASPSPGGSAHLIVDDSSCYRCLLNIQVPWGAPGANTNGFHIEQCGYASWEAREWLTHQRMLERGAYKAAYHCHLFGIPPVFLTASGLTAGKKGITTHMECSKAFGGDHHDPGDGWPRVAFIKAVKKAYAELGPAT